MGASKSFFQVTKHGTLAKELFRKSMTDIDSCGQFTLYDSHLCKYLDCLEAILCKLSQYAMMIHHRLYSCVSHHYLKARVLNKFSSFRVHGHLLKWHVNNGNSSIDLSVQMIYEKQTPHNLQKHPW